MLNVNQLRELIIKPALNDLLLYSEDAEELLVFTCAVESFGGTYIHQINGPALGIYQMEPRTYNDLWQNYIKNEGPLWLKLSTNFDLSTIPDESRLIYDLRFATAMTRIYYERIKEVLPKKDNIEAIWNYYKKYYNTTRGAAQQNSSISRYLSMKAYSHLDNSRATTL